MRKRIRHIEYEGIHLVCFDCGKYGHWKEECEGKLNRGGDQPEVNENNKDSDKDKLGNNQLKINPEILEDFGPWMLAQWRSRRNNRGIGSNNRNDREVFMTHKASH